jgi:hypothetical protein
MTPDRLDEIERAAREATPGNLDTVPNPPSEYGGKETGHYDCPLCGGEGSVDGVTYCNFDGIAMGVQFFGIGEGFGKYETFFRLANPAAVLELVADNRTLRAELAAARGEGERMREAAANLVFGASSTFRARNGRQVGIEMDDGEKGWIVHDDLLAPFRALSTSGEGG